VFVESPAGRELARTRRGEALDLVLADDGVHRVIVHDRLFRGGDAYAYRLSIGAGPWVDYVLPPVATLDQVTRLTIFGRGLPYGSPASQGLQSMPLDLRLGASDPRIGPRSAATPAELAVDTFEFPLDLGVHSAGGVVTMPVPASNPVRIGVTTLPVVLEAEANNTPESPMKVTVPVEVTGQFWPRGDVDCFAFDAKKGEVFWLEVFSQRLGLPTDPQILVQRLVRTDKATNLTDVLELADGDANPGGPEFNLTTRDPVGRLEIKEDGTYCVQLRDLFSTAAASPANVYRLALRREQPDFRLAALPVSGGVVAGDKKQSVVASTVLRRGETVPVRIIALRRDGFNGEISITASDLPPGVSAAPARMPAGQNVATLLLTAATNAAGFAGPIRFTGRAPVGDREVVRHAVGGTVVWPVADQAAEPTASRLTRESVLAVTGAESAPIRLAPSGVDPSLALPATNKLQLTVEIIRQEGWGAAFKLKPAGLAALDSVKEFDVPAGTNRVTLSIDLAAQKVPPGEHRFWLQGTVAGKWVDPVEGEALKQAEAALKEAEKVQAEAAAAAKSAAQALADAKKVAGAAELKKLAEVADRDAAARLKDWDARKTAATATAKAARDRAKVRDVTTMVYSPAITFRVAAPTAVAKK